MAQILAQDIDRWFTYHRPTEMQVTVYCEIRAKARELAELMRHLVPDGDDKLFALQKLREAVMIANAAIACEEPETCVIR